ncbi:MAG TPA: DegT/DnrJ/EryC1/StrS family aminotransferase, partial [archaeon]|nr:DegT/DnrJ/EryC1/StrS family aminotransferase [archaeon]
VTNDKKIRNTVETLRDPIANSDLAKFSKRTPCLLDSIQIAFLRAKMPFSKEWREKRRQIAKFYTEELEKTSIETPSENKNARHSYFRYVIRSENRDKLKRFLFKNGVFTGLECYELHLAKPFQDLGHKKGDFPVTERCNEMILYLPIHPFLKDEEIVKITRLINLFDKKHG